MTDRLMIAGAALIVAAGIAGYYLLGEAPLFVRVLAVIIAVIAAAAVALRSAPGQQAWEFAKAARTEVRKVVWPTRRETGQTTLIVIIMVVIIGLYMWLLDTAIFWVIYDIALGSHDA